MLQFIDNYITSGITVKQYISFRNYHVYTVSQVNLHENYLNHQNLIVFRPWAREEIFNVGKFLSKYVHIHIFIFRCIL